MYVSMSRDHSDDGFFYCYNWNIITNQTESFKIRFFVSDFAIFIRGERERERERERDVLFETTSIYRIRIISF